MLVDENPTVDSSLFFHSDILGGRVSNPFNKAFHTVCVKSMQVFLDMFQSLAQYSIYPVYIVQRYHIRRPQSVPLTAFAYEKREEADKFA